MEQPNRGSSGARCSQLAGVALQEDCRDTAPVDARSRYDALVVDLMTRDPGVSVTKMMGLPAVKLGPKLVLCFPAEGDGVVFKLPNPAHRDDALALAGAEPFDPTGRGRPMANWIIVPEEHAEEWPRLALLALVDAG
jgi:hypothetical protein